MARLASAPIIWSFYLRGNHFFHSGAKFYLRKSQLTCSVNLFHKEVEIQSLS